MTRTATPLIEPRFRLLFAVLFGIATIFGTSMTVIGATLPKILDSFGWSYLAAGQVLAANAITYFVFTFIGGYLIVHLGSKRTLSAGLGLTAVGLALFAMWPDPLPNVAIAALTGMGQGCVEIAMNATALRIDTARSGRPMNLMHGGFAVGAILGPLALGVVQSAGYDWLSVYRGMAVIFAAMVLVTLSVPMGHLATPTAPDDQVAPPQRLSRHPAYYLSFLALFFYVGVEIGVSNWIAQYFVAVFAYPATASALLVSLFWAGLLAGRFGMPLLVKGRQSDAAFLWLSVLATIAIVSLSILGFAPMGAFGQNLGLVLVALSGLGFSIYYPSVITLLGGVFPQAQSQAIGFAATGGGIGAFLFPFLMSALAQGWGIQIGFVTYAVFSLAMTLAAYGLLRASARPTPAKA